MFITELEMKDNTRLMIRGTTYIKLTFTEIHQLILGTNGCGKSTLIHELSPLPPAGNDYLKGGYKKIVIQHAGQTYTLTSRFTTQAGKHSFIHNETDEELNEGGTQSVQRTLIQEVFNYDQALHDVLTDSLRFTDMSPLQRRHWLTRISGTNLDFAIELFNKLKRAERDEDAVVKHLTSRLAKESDDLPSVEELEQLEQRFNNLDNQVREFYQFHQQTNLPHSDELFYRLEDYIKHVQKTAVEFLRIPRPINTLNVRDIDDLKRQGAHIDAALQNNQTRMEELYKEHEDISNLLNETEHVSDEASLNALLEQLKERTTYIEDLRSGLQHITTLENAIETYGRARAIGGMLIEIATNLIDNTEGYFTKAKREEKEAELFKVNTKLSSMERAISECEHSIRHIKNTDDTICPKCNHTFKAGVRAEDLPKYEARIKEINEYIAQTNVVKQEITSYLDEYNIYKNTYLKYRDIVQANSDMQFIKDYIKPIDLLVDSPKLIISRYNDCLRDLEVLADIERMLPEIYKMEALVDKVKNAQSNGNYTAARLETIEDNLAALTQQEKEYKRHLDDIKIDYQNYMLLIDKYKEFKGQLDNLGQLINNTYTACKNEGLETVIKKMMVDLSHANAELTKAKNKQNIVDDVNKSRETTMQKRDIYKVLVNEINPTTGLIADYFKQFINQFVEQMNIIINKVWEHNMELLPCDVNSEGISYKFPLRINDKEYGPPDGSKGSNSQISIVNFAFKIVVMVYLGLDDYPLYLDELAPDLDEKHRINIMSFVRSFVESKRCSQMFLVSHYASGYGAFTNAEILILDEENLIDIPQVYNKHVKIVKDEVLKEEVS